MKIIFLFIFILLCASRSYAQKEIKAEEAINHIGEIVTVHDSVYSGRVYNDSITVLNFGMKSGGPSLVVIIKGRNTSGNGKQLIHTLQVSKLKIRGQILMAGEQAIMILFRLDHNLSWDAFAR